ncbi:MAG: helix-turn-helix transcriptional regulator [Acidimicrobiales bacterium]
MDTPNIQREARALGDPTRHRLFRYIADAERPVGVAELTAHVRLNHNAVRQHLAVLKDAELVTEEAEVRDRPGRPSLLYRLHPEAAGKWETSGSYAWLAGLLADAMKHDWSPREVGRREGLRRGYEHGTDEDSVDAMEQELIRNGFRPGRSDRGRQINFVLGRCPFAEVASTNPDAVCQLHLGLAEGLAEGLGALTVDRLTVKSAHKAGCRLVIERDPVSTQA